ncbi:MAG: o-succinylbenzoate synthase [Rubricoccaceae bacterium]|nr:o-succinylbenzoate synthase [Rubricoccaceae bacterium]
MTVELYRYTIPLARPLILRRATLHERRGFLIRLAGNGSEGWGEASPLAGFSRESEEEVLRCLIKIREDGVPTGNSRAELPSNVRFAIDSAELELEAATKNTSAAEVLYVNPAARIELNGLVTETGLNAVHEAERLLGKGFNTLKVKVGSISVENDIRTIDSLSEILPQNGILRLDANQAWSFEQALHFLKHVDGSRIEYLEEPLADVSRLEELADRTQTPIALDESLVAMTPADLERCAYAAAVVLKPSLGGGVAWAREMIETALDLGIMPVLSSAFESGIGMRMHVALASGCQGSVAGLSTYKWLADDVFTERLPMDGPEVNIVDALTPCPVDFAKLERVA